MRTKSFFLTLFSWNRCLTKLGYLWLGVWLAAINSKGFMARLREPLSGRNQLQVQQRFLAKIFDGGSILNWLIGTHLLEGGLTSQMGLELLVKMFFSLVFSWSSEGSSSRLCFYSMIGLFHNFCPKEWLTEWYLVISFYVHVQDDELWSKWSPTGHAFFSGEAM